VKKLFEKAKEEIEEEKIELEKQQVK